MSVSEKIEIFDERSILVICGVLYGCLKGTFGFYIFENFYMLFRWG